MKDYFSYKYSKFNIPGEKVLSDILGGDLFGVLLILPLHGWLMTNLIVHWYMLYTVSQKSMDAA